jgi:hypothetical protein
LSLAVPRLLCCWGPWWESFGSGMPGPAIVGRLRNTLFGTHGVRRRRWRKRRSRGRRILRPGCSRRR